MATPFGAPAFLTAVAALIVYVALQKRFIAGPSLGSAKG